MYNNVMFVCGIHGVGKTTYCNTYSSIKKVIHLSASELIKDYNEVLVSNNKQVSDINKNQEVLIKALEMKISPDNTYLLDGHMVLFDTVKDIVFVGMDFFQKLAPVKILLLTAPANIIKNRLSKRERYNSFSIEELDKMQIIERKYVKKVSKEFEINFEEITNI